jgi:hypothetical protein
MKKYFGNIQTLLIVVLVIIIFLLRNCNGDSIPTEPTIITKVEVRYDTIVKEVPKYVPKYINKISMSYDTILKYHKIDTTEILKDYFATYVYEDVQKLDSLNLTIRDSISQNKIASRSIRYELIYPTTTITKEIYLNNREFYWGLAIQGSQDQLNYIGGELMYKTKKKQMYGVGIGVNQEFKPILSGRLLWKIGK